MLCVHQVCTKVFKSFYLVRDCTFLTLLLSFIIQRTQWNLTVQSLVIRQNTRRKYLSPNSLTRQSLVQLAIGSVISTGIGNGNTSSIKAPSQISSPFLKSPPPRPLSIKGRRLLSPLLFKPRPLLSLLVLHYQNKKWTDPVWFIHIWKLGSLAPRPLTSSPWAFPLCFLVVYGELIPSSVCLKK